MNSRLGVAEGVRFQTFLACIWPGLDVTSAEYRVLHLRWCDLSRREVCRNRLNFRPNPKVLDFMPYFMGCAWLGINSVNTRESLCAENSPASFPITIPFLS